MLYETILFNAGDDFGMREEVEFADDAAAVAHAREHLWPWTYEIRRGDAVVAQGKSAADIDRVIAFAPSLLALRRAA